MIISPHGWASGYLSQSWWRHQMETFPRNWPFVRGIRRSPMNSPHKGQWRGALMFSLICAWINCWVKKGEAGDLRRYRAHYDVIVMTICTWFYFALIYPFSSGLLHWQCHDCMHLSLMYATIWTSFSDQENVRDNLVSIILQTADAFFSHES